MQDILDSIKATLYERISSPLFGAFAVSWTFWNYKLIVLLLSDMDPIGKIEQIEKLYPGGITGDLSPLLWRPLASSIVFLAVYPWPAMAIYAFWRWWQKMMLNIKHKFDAEQPISAEKARKLLAQISLLEQQGDESASRHSEKVEQLQRENSRLNQEIEKKDKELTGLAEDTRRVEAAQRESRWPPHGLGQLVSKNEVKTIAQAAEQTGRVRSLRADKSLAVREGDIVSKPFILHFNLDAGDRGKKALLLLPDGVVGEGKNDNENSWRIRDGALELMHQSGQANNRFVLDPTLGWLLSTRDEDVMSRYVQVITPRLAIDGGPS